MIKGFVVERHNYISVFNKGLVVYTYSLISKFSCTDLKAFIYAPKSKFSALLKDITELV